MTLTVRRLGHLGDGVADGAVVVPFALPGEEVEGDIENGRMSAPRILRPSADRVRPPCNHFKSCGGCALQHASDDLVACWKTDLVRHALAARGIDAPITDLSTSPARSRRRAVFSGRRTKKAAMVGFHARGSGVVMEIPGCQLLDPQIMGLLPGLRQLTALAASRTAEIGLTVTVAGAGADVLIENAKPPDATLRMQAAQLAGRHGISRLTWNGELLAEHAVPSQIVDGIRVTPPPGAFLQATRHGEAALVAAVKDAVAPARRLSDLFAGCGTFSLPLARQAEVHAVESDAAMLRALDAGWRQAPGLKTVTTEVRDLFRRPLLGDELRVVDAVVIDPPRAGAEAQTHELARARVPVVAAVSCNPVTFARDAGVLLDAGYGLDWIRVVDQFRWSQHVELVARFSADPVSGGNGRG